MSNQWWGYKHTSGSLQVKRYFGIEDIHEAMESPFVARVAGPFNAETREAAEATLKRHLGIDEDKR